MKPEKAQQVGQTPIEKPEKKPKVTESTTKSTAGAETKKTGPRALYLRDIRQSPNVETEKKAPPLPATLKRREAKQPEPGTKTHPRAKL